VKFNVPTPSPFQANLKLNSFRKVFKTRNLIRSLTECLPRAPSHLLRFLFEFQSSFWEWDEIWFESSLSYNLNLITIVFDGQGLILRLVLWVALMRTGFFFQMLSPVTHWNNSVWRFLKWRKTKLLQSKLIWWISVALIKNCKTLSVFFSLNCFSFFSVSVSVFLPLFLFSLCSCTFYFVLPYYDFTIYVYYLFMFLSVSLWTSPLSLSLFFISIF